MAGLLLSDPWTFHLWWSDDPDRTETDSGRVPKREDCPGHTDSQRPPSSSRNSNNIHSVHEGVQPMKMKNENRLRDERRNQKDT